MHQFIFLTNYLLNLSRFVKCSCCATYESRELSRTTCFSSFIVDKESKQHRDKLDFGCYLLPAAVSGDDLLTCDTAVDFSLSENAEKINCNVQVYCSAGTGYRAEHGPKIYNRSLPWIGIVPNESMICNCDCHE